MNFIARHINAIGLLLLTTFVATAAGMYFNAPMRLSKSPVAAPAVTYSCPMHPEVVANQPGNCPKCGMALTSAATKLAAKPMACQHAPDAAHSSATEASSHAGCGHAEESSAGGCCSKQVQPPSDALPSGCTRNLNMQTADSD